MQRGERLFSLVHCTRDLAPYNPNGRVGISTRASGTIAVAPLLRATAMPLLLY